MHLSGDLQPLNVGCSSFTEDVSQYCYCSFVIVYIGEREVTGCCVICVMMAINRQESSGNNVLFMFYVYAIVHCILSV